MQTLYVSELIPHPKNEFFFDQMEGQKWKEFLESIKTSGVIEPPVVTSDKIIVSGHQRVRACLELGIETIDCEVRIYSSPDNIVKDLIETNVRQRGTVNGSELKTGRIITELKRIYGISRGANLPNAQNERPEKTEDELAAELGMSRATMNRLACLPKLIPELQDIVSTGKISASAACSIVAKLSEEEQAQLFQTLPSAQKMTQQQVQKAVDEMQGKLEDAENRLVANQDQDYLTLAEKAKELEQKVRDMYESGRKDEREKSDLKKQVAREQQEKAELERKLEKAVTKPAEKEIVKEVVEKIPDDYEAIKKDRLEQAKRIAELEQTVESLSELQPITLIEDQESEITNSNLITVLDDILGAVSAQREGALAQLSETEIKTALDKIADVRNELSALCKRLGRKAA